MQWAEWDTKAKEQFKDEDRPYNSYTPQYAGPLRIPPAAFQPRMRKEVVARDTTNARHIESWNTAVPIQQTEYNRVHTPYGIMTKIQKDKVPKPDSLKPVFMDMAPLTSRTDGRDFRQSQPYVPTGPNLSENPFFDRYDPTRDPRNMLREVRSAVYEVKQTDRGILESERIRSRVFSDRTVEEDPESVKLTEWFNLLRPKIDNPEIVYRNQSEIWKLGAKYDESDKL